MPQVAELSTFRPKTNLASFMPTGASDSSNTLLQKFHYSICTSFYQTFSHIPYQTLLYSLGSSDDILLTSPGSSESILPTLNKIINLLTLPDGWNGYDACAPQLDAVEYACRWISFFHKEVISSGRKWLSPNVTASDEGEVVFEWWQSTKKLTVYVSNQNAEYLKVWGPDINTDMEDGKADSDTLRLLWKWLMS